MVSLSDSGIVKAYVDNIEELCMAGILCELIICKKLSTFPLRDSTTVEKGQPYGLIVLDDTPLKIDSDNKPYTIILELLNEVLFLINAISQKCPKADVDKLTVKDWIKMLCAGRKIHNFTIYKIANVLTRVGKQLSERKVVDFKKTLFLFLSLPIKDKVERDRTLTELIIFLKMTQNELNNEGTMNGDLESTSLKEMMAFDTVTDRFLKSRYDYIKFAILGIFTLCQADILSNDVLKNEQQQDKKPLQNIATSMFTVGETAHCGAGSGLFRKIFSRPSYGENKSTSTLMDNDYDSDTNSGEASPSPLTKFSNPFPEGLSSNEELALQLKRCIFGAFK